ncbi:MAG: endonuclease III [Betaproteobacteria bacterium]|jgi:endonuclease-3
MNTQKRIQIFRVLEQKNPNPTTELQYNSNFELLISVILSAQATDVSVNKATTKLFTIANTPEAIKKLGLRKLTGHIKSIGLFKTKAENILKTCSILIDKFDGEVPKNREDLESLPGVGRKTANVVMNTAFGIPTVAVDTHIFRVSNRTKIARGKSVLEVEKKLLKLIPQDFLQNAHHWLILHGRYTCKARTPLCKDCCIAHLCEFKDKRVEEK